MKRMRTENSEEGATEGDKGKQEKEKNEGEERKSERCQIPSHTYSSQRPEVPAPLRIHLFSRCLCVSLIRRRFNTADDINTAQTGSKPNTMNYVEDEDACEKLEALSQTLKQSSLTTDDMSLKAQNSEPRSKWDVPDVRGP